MNTLWNGYNVKKVENGEIYGGGTLYILDHHEELESIAKLDDGLYVLEGAPDSSVGSEQHFGIEDGMLFVINSNCGHVMEKVLNPED